VLLTALVLAYVGRSDFYLVREAKNQMKKLIQVSEDLTSMQIDDQIVQP
jgi:hypothetical protein